MGRKVSCIDVNSVSDGNNMQRNEFLSRITATALLVSGIRQNIWAQKAKVSSNQDGIDFELPHYPIERTDEILSSIQSKVFIAGMELNLYLDSFLKELELRFPLQDKNQITSYQELYSFSITTEILCELTIKVIGLWENLCIQIGLDGYTIEDFKKDSETIKTSMIDFGKKIQNRKIPILLGRSSNEKWWNPLEVYIHLPWFGGTKTEKIISTKIYMDQIFNLEPELFKESNQCGFSQSTSDFFRNTKELQNNLDRIRAKWHQYAVRFYYMDFAQREYETKKSINKLQTSPINYQNLIRSYSFESALKTIQNRAYHMQSSVYHYEDRQTQQMVVSSLILMMKDLGDVTRSDKNLLQTLKLEDPSGSIITISTGMWAKDSLRYLEEGILFLKEERKRLITEKNL